MTDPRPGWPDNDGVEVQHAPPNGAIIRAARWIGRQLERRPFGWLLPVWMWLGLLAVFAIGWALAWPRLDLLLKP
jgi:hypothetical protein